LAAEKDSTLRCYTTETTETTEEKLRPRYRDVRQGIIEFKEAGGIHLHALHRRCEHSIMYCWQFVQITRESSYSDIFQPVRGHLTKRNTKGSSALSVKSGRPCLSDESFCLTSPFCYPATRPTGGRAPSADRNSHAHSPDA